MTNRTGPHSSGQAHPTPTAVARAAGASGIAHPAARHQPVPAALVEVALVDAPTSAAVGGMSVSWWHAEVAAGRAPAPVLRRPRCTRWRMADVREFWRTFGQEDDTGTADAVKALATKASAAARAKRGAGAAATQAGE